MNSMLNNSLYSNGNGNNNFMNGNIQDNPYLIPGKH